MEVTINMEDYLDEETRRQIAVDCFRDEIRRKFSSEKEIERIIGNSYYTFMVEELSKIVPNYEERLAKRVEEAVTNKSLDYEIFYKGDFGREDSAAHKIITRTVNENTELIKQKVVDAINNYDLNKMIQQKFYEAFAQLSDSAGNIANFIWKNMVEPKEQQ